MSLYPSLEDMKVDQMAQAQATYATRALEKQPGAGPTAPAWQASGYGMGPDDALMGAGTPVGSGSLYPSLEEYMGLELTQDTINLNMPVVAANPPQAPVARSQMQVVAPVSGDSLGIHKAEIRAGVRQVVLCKDASGKMGLRVRAVDKGVFVAFVDSGSPAAMAGVRFGDQILQINNEPVAGWDTDKTMKRLIACPVNGIRLDIRDRPFERTLTLQKDSAGHVGFIFHENKITSLIKDSSAARNGLLIEHHMVEVDGQNVVGMKEADIKKVFDAADRSVTITIIPSFIYEHIVKCMGSSLIKKMMDHSIPDV